MDSATKAGSSSSTTSRSIVDAVATALRYEGFEVEEAATDATRSRPSRELEPDLSCSTGCFPTSRASRSAGGCASEGFKTAILFLTAKDAVENKVEALRAGGDDYVTKPFSLAEVVARVQAILRRTRGDLPGDVLRFADLVARRGAPRGLPRRHARSS